MNTYKHPKTAEAMRAVLEAFDMADALNAELEKDKAIYNAEAYNARAAEAQAKFSGYYSAAKAAVAEAVDDMRKRGEKARCEALDIGGAAEDFKLLGLPVTLTADELRAMAKRNEGNMLFGRAVAEYAQKHGYSGSNYRDLEALAFTRDEYAKHMENAETFARYVGGYLETENLAQIKQSYNGAIVRKYDEDGLFTEV